MSTVLDELHCGPREARLRLMARNDPTSPWFHLNAEDRDAIQWAFDRIVTLEHGLMLSRKRAAESWTSESEMRKRVENVAKACREALG